MTNRPLFELSGCQCTRQNIKIIIVVPNNVFELTLLQIYTQPFEQKLRKQWLVVWRSSSVFELQWQ